MGRRDESARSGRPTGGQPIALRSRLFSEPVTYPGNILTNGVRIDLLEFTPFRPSERVEVTFSAPHRSRAVRPFFIGDHAEGMKPNGGSASFRRSRT
ncbi:hypothetical protein PCAR4_40205 [Paraburkholderia caribensis]|nr:hypothetical protein PCAR4_40205 [Paraburkholderia caribensis]